MFPVLATHKSTDFGVVAEEVLKGLEYRLRFNYRDNSGEEKKC